MIYNFIKRYWWHISLVLLLTTAILSLLPASALPSAPGTDKLHHFIAYMAISLPIAIARPKYWWIGIVLVIATSGVIELIQPMFNRYGDWLDLLANSTGVLLAIIMSALYRAMILRQ